VDALEAAAMFEKRLGDPCPQCATPLQRRRSSFRTIAGDVAYCAACRASFELAKCDQFEQDERIAALRV
jgi:hypothetical protein